MPDIKEEGQTLLHDSDPRQSYEADQGWEQPTTSRNANFRDPPNFASDRLITTLLLSVLANLALALLFAFILFKSHLSETSIEVLDSRSAYAGLRHDPTVSFPYSEGYGPEVIDHVLADERWEAIDINPGVVAVTHEWAETHNLPESQPFPWDPSKSLYTITAFHTLHCLKNIHRIIYDAHHGRPLSRDVGHALHCLDHMRKDAMCNADDFLLPTPPNPNNTQGPRGQSRVCRNWEDLLQWADEHHACYQHMSDDETGFAETHAEIERYHGCPSGSPYETKMKQYFGQL